MRTSNLLMLVAMLAVASPALAQDDQETRSVEGGGITGEGWMGSIDASEAAKGLSLADSKFMAHDGMLMVTTGPAGAYWNAEHVASGNYTVSATFTEPEFMNVNDHPHPYGIVIGGNDMSTDTQSYLYCAAYGTGTYIVRGFGPEAFRLSDRRPVAHDAVNKAADKNQSVSQMIAVTVSDESVSCSINGTVVAT
ncbi:MAG: hypothetical protein ACI84D_003783, partial [Thalassolituus oleivorans]